MITLRIVCSYEETNRKMPKPAPIRLRVPEPIHLRHSIIRKIARRVGSKRVSSHVYPKCTSLLTYYLQTMIKDAIAYCENGRRKTVNDKDIRHALALHGMSMHR